MRYSAAAVATALLCLAGDSLAKDWESPPYTWLYQFPLPIPQVKQEKFPGQFLVNPVTQEKIKYYEVEIKPFTQKIYPNLPATPLVGYDGVSPGLTFVEEKGVQSVVRFINRAKLANSVHLHGSVTRAVWDGWAEDLTQPGQFKDYYYPNSQNARTLWYHDHAEALTAQNAYFGQAGAYILHDDEERATGLPSGKYDIPMILNSKQYNKDGTLVNLIGREDSLWGDLIHVNGQPWPYMNVEPRKYRFRFLDASVSRTFLLYLETQKAPGTKIEFNVVGSDSGLLTGPQKTKDLYISLGERYEVVIDFAPFAGQNLTLRNNNDFGTDDKPYLHTDKVMRFVVSSTRVTDTSRVPSTFRQIPFLANKPGVDRKFLFHRQGGLWRINGVVFSDVKNRILAKPTRGSIETWELENGGGGWSHPIHLHLVDFQVVSRKNGKRGTTVYPYESQGLKDVVWLAPGETVTVRAHFQPHSGLYMWHCHNLIHEDHEMMAAFNVTQLPEWGYDTTAFDDPLNATFRAVPMSANAGTLASVQARFDPIFRQDPYAAVDQFDTWFAQYTATRKGGLPTQTPSPSSSSGSGSGSGSSRVKREHTREMPHEMPAGGPE